MGGKKPMTMIVYARAYNMQYTAVFTVDDRLGFKSIITYRLLHNKLDHTQCHRNT